MNRIVDNVPGDSNFSEIDASIKPSALGLQSDGNAGDFEISSRSSSLKSSKTADLKASIVKRMVI